MSQIGSDVCCLSHGIVLSQSRLGSWGVSFAKACWGAITVVGAVRGVTPVAEDVGPGYVLGQLVIIAVFVESLAQYGHVYRQEKRLVSGL